MSRRFNSPFRVWRIFRLLLTFFLLIKKRESLFFVKPLSPKKLGKEIVGLGASFIKLAQVLATRADFFSDDYLSVLKTLHDELPPMDENDFKKVYKRAFGNRDYFKSFDKTPIASASIGQVHIAYLKDGKKVAVKLRREGIVERVKKDIMILKIINFIFKPLFSYYTKNSIESVIKEFSKMISQEVSLKKEAENLKKFSKTYSYCDILFPVGYDQFSSDDAFVMSYMEGYRFDDKEALKKSGVDFNKVIEKLVNFYAEQMLVVGYFHADPHPGNLLVDKNGNLILLDFGMVKRVTNETRRAIIEMIKSAYEKDYELYVSSAKRLGVIAYEAPKSELAEFVESMFEIFSDNTLSALSMQTLAFEILKSMRDLPFKLPQEAIYILRVSAIVEGLGTTYIENFNGIKDILPILQKNIPRALGANEGVLELLINEIKGAPFILKDLKDTLKKTTEGSLKVEISLEQLTWMTKELKNHLKPILLSFAAMIGAIFLLLISPSLKIVASIIFILALSRLFYL